MESQRRAFAGELRHFVVLTDQICRTAWCDAPVRHVDHIVRAADGGPTSAENGQGLCETCNYTKEAPGWTARRLDLRRHEVEITTPTGHSYRSTAPDPPRPHAPVPDLIRRYADAPSPPEDRLRALVAA